MKTNTGWLMVAACMALVSSASAQGAPGTADPLGLASVGVVLPFVAHGDNVSLLELASPVGPNSSPGGRALRIAFFSADCKRDTYHDVAMTSKDIEIIDVSLLTPLNRGLMVIAGVGRRDSLVPVSRPIHAGVRWINVPANIERELEPITIQGSEASPNATWNPLRTAAAFSLPLLSASQRAELTFICPSASITGVAGAAGVVVGAPPLNPPGAALLWATIYDDDERPLRNTRFPCRCLTVMTPDQIPGGTVYSDAMVAPRGTFTVVFGGAALPQQAGSGSFTGYRAIETGAVGTASDGFGRLRNGSSSAILSGQPGNNR